MISTASPPPLRIPPNRQDTPPAEPAKKFKSLRLALYGSNPGYPTGTGSSVNLRVGLAGTKDKRRQRTAQQVSSTRGRSARPMKISGVLPQSGLANAPVKQTRSGGTGTRRLRLEPGPQSGQGFLTESELECRAAVGTSPDHRVHRQQIWLGSHRLPPLAEHQRLAVQLARRAWP